MSPLLALSQAGSYAPPAGQLGSTAMHQDSSVFVAWATGAVGTAGPQRIDQPNGPLASVGSAASTVGQPGANGVFSLGTEAT